MQMLFGAAFGQEIAIGLNWGLRIFNRRSIFFYRASEISKRLSSWLFKREIQGFEAIGLPLFPLLVLTVGCRTKMYSLGLN